MHLSPVYQEIDNSIDELLVHLFCCLELHFSVNGVGFTSIFSSLVLPTNQLRYHSFKHSTLPFREQVQFGSH